MRVLAETTRRYGWDLLIRSKEILWEKSRRQLALAKRKIISEDELVGLEEKVNRQVKSRSAFLKKAISQLRRSRPGQARILLARAIEQERRAVAIQREMKSKEEELLNLLKVEL